MKNRIACFVVTLIVSIAHGASVSFASTCAAKSSAEIGERVLSIIGGEGGRIIVNNVVSASRHECPSNVTQSSCESAAATVKGVEVLMCSWGKVAAPRVPGPGKVKQSK